MRMGVVKILGFQDVNHCVILDMACVKHFMEVEEYTAK